MKRDNYYQILDGKKFDIEHALSLYASSYCVLPAEFIYEKEKIEIYQGVIDRCHIYIIGYLPKIRIENSFKRNRDIFFELTIGGKHKSFRFPIPDDMQFFQEKNKSFLIDQKGKRFKLTKESLTPVIADILDFKVKYIGQAYGSNGSRNALDRLLKHETLQKISLKGVPDGYDLSLLLLEVEPNTQLVTLINPRAQHQDDGTRIDAGNEKLYNTSESERISLFEASFIRYFSPEFNKEFKKSFPSTNLKVLQDCYEKDFTALFTEILIEELPFRLCSETVQAKVHHLARHDLHSEFDRKLFFHSELNESA